MEGEFGRRGEACPQLLNLIPNGKKDFKVKDTGGGKGYGAEEERKLELRLGPPGGEDEQPSVLSLGYFPCAGAKRVFLDTVKPETEGLGKELTSQRTSLKAEQQNLEKKKAVPAGPNSTTQTRSVSVPVVGWPPIRSFRKNLASSSSKPVPESKNKEPEAAGVKLDSCRKGLFVKINMDGIPIGRKVDLNAHESYEKLSIAVEELFQGLLAAQRDPSTVGSQNADDKQAFRGLLDGSGEYTLVYEDNEGDRMLVGDVPWGMFVSTAKRLRVLKTSELSALYLGAVSRKRTAADC